MLMSPRVSCCLNLSAGLPESTHTAVSPGDLLYSPFFTYQANNVLKCTHMATNVTVAIKMMKNKGFLMEQASSEVSKKFQWCYHRPQPTIGSLLLLSESVSSIARLMLCVNLGPATTSSTSTKVSSGVGTAASCSNSRTKVWRTSWRSERGSVFLWRRSDPFSCRWAAAEDIRFTNVNVELTYLRVFQLARALDFMKAESFVHADIKLENVMLVNHQKEPFRIKLIDFGLAGKISKVEKGQTLQTLSYRSAWTLASEAGISASRRKEMLPSRVFVPPQVSRDAADPSSDRGRRYVVIGVSGGCLARGQSPLQWPKRLWYYQSSMRGGVAFVVDVAGGGQCDRMLPALFLDVADRPNAGLPIKPAVSLQESWPDGILNPSAHPPQPGGSWR